MSSNEINRLEVIQRVVDKRLKQKQAAERLGISIRQVKRLVREYKHQGAIGLISKQRGKPSNRRHTSEFNQRVMDIIKEHYHDFGPTFTSEKLKEREGIKISIESTRKLMIQHGLWKAKKEKVKVIHPSRLRRGCYGELIQIDGSPHDWFEGRGPRCTLLVFIDDATSRVQLLRFVPAETTFAYFHAMQLYIERYGKPVALYSDKLGVFKVNAKDPITGTGLTQFGRAMEALKIELIYANSPEAKGRVERSNATHQDRLIKELRLRGISDMDTANKFLDDIYTEMHNTKFAVLAREATDVHIPLSDLNGLGLVFTLHSERKVSKTLSVPYKEHILQINVPGKGYHLRQAKVIICEHESGEITVLHNNKSLSYTLYDKKQHYKEAVSAKELDTKISLAFKNPHFKYVPPANHPWKQAANKAAGLISRRVKLPKELDDSVSYLDIWNR